MRIFILSSDKTAHALPGTLYLLDKFWTTHPPVIIGGYTKPDIDLHGAWFHSIGKFEDYPVEKWSDGVIEFLQAYQDELIVLWMDDYWLIRDVDTRAVELLEKHVLSDSRISRCDLTVDRLHAGGASVFGTREHLDLITNDPPAQYALSFQAGIWRRKKLIQYLAPGESAWQSELNGTTRMNMGRAYIIGTKQGPVKYLIAVQQGHWALDGGYQGSEYALTNELKSEMNL